MKHLYILRHAKAEPAQGRQSDTERALSFQGKQACQTVGTYLRVKRLLPDYVLVSSARRTQETCNLVMQAAKMDPVIVTDKGLYLATADDIASKIQSQDDVHAAVMVIGHNPGVHQLALMLTQPIHSYLYHSLEVKYPPGALCVLQFDSMSWQDITMRTGKLIDFMVSS